MVALSRVKVCAQLSIRHIFSKTVPSALQFFEGVTLLIYDDNFSLNSLCCIYLSFADSHRIVGGSTSLPHSWPWQVSLRKSGKILNTLLFILKWLANHWAIKIIDLQLFLEYDLLFQWNLVVNSRMSWCPSHIMLHHIICVSLLHYCCLWIESHTPVKI